MRCVEDPHVVCDGAAPSACLAGGNQHRWFRVLVKKKSTSSKKLAEASSKRLKATKGKGA
jgi:hypothetical protein